MKTLKSNLKLIGYNTNMALEKGLGGEKRWSR